MNLFLSWFILIIVALCAQASGLDKKPSPGSAHHPATSGSSADQHVVSIPRGGSQKVTCGDDKTVSVLEAGYAEMTASKSKPASYALPVCSKNLALVRTLFESCEVNAAACLIKAQDSLKAPAGCRWKFLVVTYKCNESEGPVVFSADYGTGAGGLVAA